jgi:hypothetical protein
MGIKLGDISPLAGALTGKGMFGKGMAKLADSGMGMLLPMSYLAKSERDKDEKKKKKADGTRPMVGEEGSEGEPTMRKGGKVKKMAKGGSTASKRADGCATKGKTKGRFV